MRKRHIKKNRTQEQPKELVQVPWKIGLPADYISDVRESFNLPFLIDPEVIGKDDNGLIVRWYLPDSTLTMKRLSGQNGPYRVAKIEPNEGFCLPESKGETL